MIIRANRSIVFQATDLCNMHYPVLLSQINNDLELYVPDPLLVRATYEKLRSENEQTPFPFWAKIWPSAYAISAFLKDQSNLVKNKKILELGAGIGIPSFSASHLASELIISDHSADAVDLINKNIDHLGLQNVKAINFDWNDFKDIIPADVLLLSDISYASDQFEPLLTIINHYLEQKTTIILSTPQRINITPFAESLQPFIRQSILYVHKHEDHETEIRVLVLFK